MGLLAGKVALVTGAGSGIGRETALLLARDGARVALVGRRREPLDDAAGAIRAAGGVAEPFVADIAEKRVAAPLIARVAAALGPVDILVNNAGSASRVLNVLWIEEEDWEATLNVNLNAVFRLTQAVLPSMLARGGGTIITVSSLAALNPNLLGGAAYGPAKAGVRNFMGFIHNTFRNQGIRATTILPGETDTPIMDSRARPPTGEERAIMLNPHDVARAVHLCASLQAGAMIPELHICPTRMRDIAADLDTARALGAPEG